MQWNNWGVKGGVAVVVMAAMVGCMPVQPVTPAAGDASAEATSEATAAVSAPVTNTVTNTVTDTVTDTVATGESYDDPFAYCAAVGTVDEPDARYTGEELPDVIAEGIRAAFDAKDVDLEVFQRGTVWRCMDHEVYACNVGANIPCLAKADESREPAQPLIDYCKENAGSDFIPAVVTGRSTVYEWACDDTEPVIVDQFTEVDSQGFLEFAWHKLTPPELK
jgi:hypothetical protein